METLSLNKNLIEQNLMSMNEAEYQGRNVALGKPMQGDVKNSKFMLKIHQVM